MRKRYLIIASILTLSMLLTLGYVATQNFWINKGNNKGPMLPGQIDKNASPENDSENSNDNIDPVKAQMKAMSLGEKIGQLVMVGIDGYENDDQTKQLIKKYHVGGFVLLQQNIKDTRQMLSLINSLKATNSMNKIPLFLSIDEEGGRISRMPAEFEKIPSNQRIGEINNSELSYKVGGVIGQELKAFGLNMNFAPVLDINSNPQNPIIGDRAFGDNASLVGKLGVQTMKGLQSQNIISVVKHFPGHGDTSVDSHIGLPTVNHGMDRLNSLELLPFSEAIEHNADAIMMAHILLPKIDSNYPASFSEIIISDLLRRDMAFDGLIITDDMTMGAIVNNYDIGQAAVKSIKAGSDIVLVCHDYAKMEDVLEALHKANETGNLSLERINQSVYRIIKLKQNYLLSDEKVESVDINSLNDKIKTLLDSFL